MKTYIFSGICSWIVIGLGIFVGHEFVTAFDWHPFIAYTMGQFLVWFLVILLLMFYLRPLRFFP